MLSVCVCVRLLALDLTELFQNHKFVGCVDQTKALIQHQVCSVSTCDCVTDCFIHRLSST